MGFDLGQHLELLKERVRGGKILVLTHDNPDPDSLAAALGLRLLFQKNGMSTSIGLGGIIGRAENRAMVRELKIDLVAMATLHSDDFAAFALVDTQPGTGNNSLPAGRRCDVCVDHHPLRATTPTDILWSDIRPEVGATATIVYDYIKTAGIELDPMSSTAFLYAIKSETRDLGRESGIAERDAYVELMQTLDLERLYRITHPKLPREHFIALDRALRSTVQWGELLAINLGALDYPDLVAEVADLMLAYDRARWVICVGRHHGAVYLSLRTDVTNVSAGSLIRRVVGARGAAGGHGMVAGGRMFAEIRSDEELKFVYDDLVARVLGELKMSATPSPLL
jgi:nanoRNase/pAp phosphatase (c-di-AMP/oligoRNAs hydrolase)